MKISSQLILSILMLPSLAHAQGIRQPPVTPSSPASEFVRVHVPPLTSVNFAENTTSFILNPERGLYRHLNLFADPAGGTLYDQCVYARARGYSVIYTQAILSQTFSLSTADLEKISTGFNDIRACGAKAIVRFYYIEDDKDKESCNGAGFCTDPPRTTILNHIAQIKPHLAQHADVIMAVQAGFVGPWGEWHNSTLSNDSDRSVILNALLDAVPAKRMVQVRTPAKRHAIFSGSPTVSKANAIGATATGPQPFDESQQSRAGHHNDCFLSTLTDQGTYSDYGSDAYIAEQDYIEQNARYTPMGGETCDFHSDYNWSEDEVHTRALDEMRRMHWTYLNGGHSPMVRFALGARDLDYDDPNSGYHVQSAQHIGVWPEILRRLGYRIILPAVSFKSRVKRGGLLQFRANIKNVGFAAMFNERPVYLVLHNQLNTYKFKLNADPRRWEGRQRRWKVGQRWWEVMQQILFSQSVTVPSNAVPAVYTLSLWLPDAAPSLQARPEYAVRFAHSDALWDSSRGYNILKVNGVRIIP